MDKARDAALATLGRILDKNQDLDRVLAALPNDLDPRDRAFVRQLVATCLRQLGRIDDLIETSLRKPLPPRMTVVRHILRLGITQLLFMDVPNHAAINTSVELLSRQKDKRTAGFKGLVNAVLRRMTRQSNSLLRKQDPLLALPDWLQYPWVDAWGEEAVADILAVQASEPPLDISLKPGEDAQAWAEKLEADMLPTGSLRRKSGGRIEDLPGYSDGRWWVQDTAATLPVKLLGDLDGQHVIDMCAAPGGKTMQLAAADAQVTAVDRSENRLVRLKENMARLDLAAQVVAADGAAWTPDAPVDAVLLDAPCSTTGTLRRHPDVAWLKGQEDVDKLAPLQAKLLAHCASYVRPGGLMVYCVCSLQPEEGAAQIEAFLADNPDWKRDKITASDTNVPPEMITPDGDLRTLPSMLSEAGGMDGFFAARLIKST
jgi:16S rRNA (cytosine967-C5)-methyltransferase